MEKELVQETTEQKLTRGIEFLEEEKRNPEEYISKDGLVRGIEFEDNPDLDKEYLIFFVYGDDDAGEVKDWKLITGRRKLYEFIKDMIETMNLDESFVLSDKSALEGRLTVYEFMKHVVEEQNLYPEDGFNIDNYR